VLCAAAVASLSLGPSPAFAAATLFVDGATGSDVSNTTCDQPRAPPWTTR